MAVSNAFSLVILYFSLIFKLRVSLFIFHSPFSTVFFCFYFLTMVFLCIELGIELFVTAVGLT
jgi:hypothetical protein